MLLVFKVILPELSCDNSTKQIYKTGSKSGGDYPVEF